MGSKWKKLKLFEQIDDYLESKFFLYSHSKFIDNSAISNK